MRPGTLGASPVMMPDRCIRMPKAIAIIDDDAAVRDSLAELLSSAGYHVCTYCTGLEFLEAARTTMPDGVIIDHQMPEMTGLELAERLGHAILQTKLIMISGNLTDTIRTRAMRAGIVAILEKPFSDNLLLATIESQLGRAKNN